MYVGIGSENKAKVTAVQGVFAEADVKKGFNVDSGVSSQPFSDEETKTGAVNRAQSVTLHFGMDVGIGLEGGVQPMKDGLYLCNWGALADKEGHVFTASGAKILLPSFVASELYDGKELKDVMRSYVDRTGVSQSEGAVGVFTGGIVQRREMYIHILKLLYGQWSCARRN